MLTATHIHYYHLCPRKLWLFSRGLQMEQWSELVAQGKQIHESSYPQRSKKYKELALEGIKIDRFDPKEKLIREIKKSNKMEAVHIAQLKYYIWRLEQEGIEVKAGVLEYPKLRETERVYLSEQDRIDIPQWIKEAEKIINNSECPPLLQSKICKKCAYYEFCYANEP